MAFSASLDPTNREKRMMAILRALDWLFCKREEKKSSRFIKKTDAPTPGEGRQKVGRPDRDGNKADKKRMAAN